MYCLSSFCCVCLSEGPKLQDINQLDTDGLPLINKIIFVSFGHEAIDFKVVKYICPECINILQLAYKFKRSCLMNHELLRIYSGQLKYFTGKVSEYQDLIVSLDKLPEKNEENKTEVHNEVPTIVAKEKTRRVQMVKTVSTKYTARKKKNIKVVQLKCIVCDASFNRYVLLQMHYYAKHKSFFKVKKQNTMKNDTTTSYTCNICSSKLCSLYSLTRHLQLHAPILCKFCPARLENIDTYKTHIVANHADRTALRCNICDLLLENDFLFRRHMFLKHSPRKCNHCDMILFSNSELLTHIHETHRSYKCNFCEKSFTLQKKLRNHLKQHKTIATPKIPKILEIPEIPEILEIPEIQETQEIQETLKTKPNIPQVPNEKVAFQTVSLNSHLRKKCTNCLSVFSSLLSLKKHKCFELKNMFQCNKCDIFYSKKASFTNHMKHCIFSSKSEENLSNTPELQESEQIAITSDANLIEANEENVVKNEDDLDIKEEFLEDFVCVQKEKPIEIGEVYSISEFSEIDSPQFEAPKQKAKLKLKSPRQRKKIFPKIKMIEKDPNIVCSLKLRWKDLRIPVKELIETNPEVTEVSEVTGVSEVSEVPEITEVSEVLETPAEVPEMSSSCDKLKIHNLRSKSALVDESETVFANTVQIHELSSNSGDSAAKFGDNQKVEDPLLGFEAVPKSSNSVSENSFAIRINPAEIVEKVNQKRRKSIWSGGVLIKNTHTAEQSSNIEAESSIIGTEASNIETESSNLGTESSNFGTRSSNFVTESSNIETESSNIGTRSSNFVTESSNIGTESSNIGTESSNIGTESSNFGTGSSNFEIRSSNIVTESSNIVNKSSNIGTESSNFERESSNYGTRSSNIVTESSNIVNKSSNIGTESSNFETESSNFGITSLNITTESSNIVTGSSSGIVTRRRKSIWSEDTSNENSNDSLFDKTIHSGIVCPKKGPTKKRRKSIWLDDVVELNETFTVDDNTTSSIIQVEPEKPPIKKRRKSMWEDTSNENSNESSATDKTEIPEKVPAKKPIMRRKSIWSDYPSNENSNDSCNLQEQSDNKKEPIRRRRKSVFMESNEDSSDVTTTNPIRGRRKSTLTEEDLSNISTTEAESTNSKSDESKEKPNLEPIILKTRRSIKRKTKARRKTICGLEEVMPETQENPVKPSDVNKNIENEDRTKLNSNCDVQISPDFSPSNCSSIQTFKLRSLRRKSVCFDGQMPENIDDDDDLNIEKNHTNYITVRKISDINNDISGQPN